jgi:DNA-binding HxlR family transcriptional regulator
MTDDVVRPERIHPACPTSAFPIQVGGKWTGMAILCLSDGPRRFSELRAQLTPVTPKVLTQTLRDMSRDGLVVRRDHQQNPPHVTYELTDLGRSLIDVIDAARAWSKAHLPDLLAARAAHDRA